MVEFTASGAGPKSIGITVQSYSRWRKDYGGLKTGQVKRIKKVQAKNLRLQKL